MDFKRWGLSGRKKLKKTSPFASLLVELGPGLSDEELSGLRLAITVDKVISRKKLSAFKNGSDFMLLLYQEGLISPTDTRFLEHLLNQVGRKDLEKQVRTYSEKHTAQSENTPPSSSESTKPKTVFSPLFTRLKQPRNDTSPMRDVHATHGPPVTHHSSHSFGPPALDSPYHGPPAVDSPAQSPTSLLPHATAPGMGPPAVRPAALGLEVGHEVVGATGGTLSPRQFSFSTMPLQPSQCARPNTEGMSNAFTQIQTKSEDVASPTDSPQEDSWTQMSIDSSQKSAMSISDDEKMYMSEKVWLMENEENANFPM